MALISVSANDLTPSGLALDVTLPRAWLDAELEGTEAAGDGEGRFEGRLSLSGSDVVVRGRVRAPVAAACARCNEPAKIAVDAELSLLLRPLPSLPPPKKVLDKGADKGGKAASASMRAAGPDKPALRPHAPKEKPAKPTKKDDVEYELTAGEADEDVFDGETVVLDGFIRELILLEMPSFPLCSEACPGIGAPAGEPPAEAAPLDPRLAPLAALKDRMSSAQDTKKRTKKE